ATPQRWPLPAATAACRGAPVRHHPPPQTPRQRHDPLGAGRRTRPGSETPDRAVAQLRVGAQTPPGHDRGDRPGSRYRTGHGRHRRRCAAPRRRRGSAARYRGANAARYRGGSASRRRPWHPEAMTDERRPEEPSTAPYGIPTLDANTPAPTDDRAEILIITGMSG